MWVFGPICGKTARKSSSGGAGETELAGSQDAEDGKRFCAVTGYATRHDSALWRCGGYARRRGQIGGDRDAW